MFHQRPLQEKELNKKNISWRSRKLVLVLLTKSFGKKRKKRKAL